MNNQINDYIEKGTQLLFEGKVQEAIDTFQKAMKIDNTNPQLWNNLGVAMLNGGYRAEELIPVFARAVNLNPNYFDARFNLAIMLRDTGNFEKAIDQFYKALEIDPKMTRAYNELSLCLREEGRLSEAEKILKKAIEIESNIPQLYNNLGNVYGDMGRYKEEEEAYKKALKINPEYALAWGNLGSNASIQGNNKKALEYYEKALKISPNIPDLYQVYGTVLQEEGKLIEAKNNYEKAIKLDDRSYRAYNSLYLIKRQLCEWDNLSFLEKKIDELGHEDPFTTVLRSDDPEKNFIAAKNWAQDISKKAGIKRFLFEINKNKKKLRLGYLSNDLRDHPVGQMVAPLFELHNRNDFEVFVYSHGRNDNSIYRKMAEKGADKFTDVRFMTDDQAASLIYNDKIDILIELTGYTLGNKLGICARRPAPIQITWLGFPGTIGGDFFDYLIADKIVVPEINQKFFTEKIIYLPNCYQINNNTIKVNKKNFSKKNLGLPDDKFIFTCFCQAYKIEPVIWKTWMNILKKVPKSILWLWEQDKEASENLSLEAKKLGVDPSRLYFAKRLPKEEHLGRLNFADLSLDTLIYGGHTTTSDSLWAEVPVITKIGSHFASRVCASILTTAGLKELIVDSLENYEKLALKLANNPKMLKKIKSKISQNNLKKNLFNTEKFVKELESVYKKIWSNIK